MAIQIGHPTTVTRRTERPVQRWADLAARAIPWVILPQGLWRLPFAFNFTMGQLDPDAPAWVWWAVPYTFGLTLVSEALAWLSLGLVRWWGEVLPAWLPVIGGRRVPPFAAIVPAALGGLTLSVAMLMVLPLSVLSGSSVSYSNAWWGALAGVCFSLLALWGPLLLVVTYGYYVRRCRPAAASERA
ncbi:hypothetical protein [Kitasatospora sp. A2-31]|uniref:hypothetical protein n=1 Tax=Kitasatospora sp. A2-31 TaxID=2916414 RepID=UPI001EEABF09|nr:hypothetical protein [Kitasatospora sp. A2-31]MCG6495244.1 hypothetical protein [Kitasatospora sp. A2-31]